MTPDFKSKLRQLLIKHEGYERRLYQDSLGIWTIGVGYNIQARGLPDSMIDTLLARDMEDTFNSLYNRYFWFKDLSEVRQMVLVDMAFMGVEKFNGFTKMIAALRLHDYETAATEMLNSKWAQQVGSRALDLAKMMREG